MAEGTAAMYGKGLAALVLVALTAGCMGREATLQRLREDNPRVQTAAIARVVREGDHSMTGELIKLLDSEDEGVRFMAASGLHQLTGRTTRYHFAKPEERQRLIAEWRQWWEQESGESLTPSEPVPPGPGTDATGGTSATTSKERGS